MPKNAKSLTPKQERFVQEYLIDLNGTQAAIRAGYSAKTADVIASENLAKPSIAAAVKAAQEKRAEKAEVDAQWVLDRLVENVERSMQRVPVIGDGDGSIGIWTYQGAVANQALSQIGKHTGGFADKVDHNVTGEIKLGFVQFSPDMLEEK